MNPDINTEHRLTTLEGGYGELNKKVDTIMNNHLVHLQADVSAIKSIISEKQGADKGMNAMWVVILGIVTTLASLSTLTINFLKVW